MPCSSGSSVFIHSGPCCSPSKLVEPIMAASSTTVPGTGFRLTRPLSGLWTSRRSRLQRSGEIREYRFM